MTTALGVGRLNLIAACCPMGRDQEGEPMTLTHHARFHRDQAYTHHRDQTHTHTHTQTPVVSTKLEEKRTSPRAREKRNESSCTFCTKRFILTRSQNTQDTSIIFWKQCWFHLRPWEKSSELGCQREFSCSTCGAHQQIRCLAHCRPPPFLLGASTTTRTGSQKYSRLEDAWCFTIDHHYFTFAGCSYIVQCDDPTRPDELQTKLVVRVVARFVSIDESKIERVALSIIDQFLCEKEVSLWFAFSCLTWMEWWPTSSKITPGSRKTHTNRGVEIMQRVSWGSENHFLPEVTKPTRRDSVWKRQRAFPVEPKSLQSLFYNCQLWKKSRQIACQSHNSLCANDAQKSGNG